MDNKKKILILAALALAGVLCLTTAPWKIAVFVAIAAIAYYLHRKDMKELREKCDKLGNEMTDLLKFTKNQEETNKGMFKKLLEQSKFLARTNDNTKVYEACRQIEREMFGKKQEENKQ